MKLKYSILYLGLILAIDTQAAPNDLFLQSTNFLAQKDEALHIGFSVDAVNDTLDILDIRESEGITDKSAGDYQGLHLAAQYDFNPQWSIEGSFWHREIDYSKDTNKIQSYLFGINFLPHFNLSKNNAIKLRASIWGNTADALDKTTPTKVNSYNFEHVKVKNPEDLQLQFDTIFSHKIDHMNQINFLGTLGWSKTKIDSLQVQTSRFGCPFNITISSNNQYLGHGLESCIGTTIQGNASSFGLDVQKDLNYTSYYAGFGGSWNFRYQKFESQLAYSYQRLWRNDIDDRIRNFGNQAIKDNHSLGAKFSYDVHPKITPFIKAELYQNNFVGQIPFLYNGITASRLDKRYGLASLGVVLRHF